jgi:hypothetical protein
MTFQVDFLSLNVVEFAETALPIASEWNAWENQQLTVKRFIYGVKRVWTLRCVEKDVAWSNSAAKYLEDRMQQNATVTLTVSEGNRYQLSSTPCHILRVEMEMRLVGGQNIRYFTVQLKEA